jgi:hypothetical protein
MDIKNYLHDVIELYVEIIFLYVLYDFSMGGMGWIDLAQDRVQWRGYCEHGNELSGSIKCWEILE